jgi:hypothetical protein
MKNSHVAACVAGAVLLTVAIEETRIASLRRQFTVADIGDSSAARSDPAVASAGFTAADGGPAVTRSGVRPGPAANPAKPADDGTDEIAKSARKMWENPAARSMMNQGVKMAVGMMYGELIAAFDFTEEEAEHFRELLGASIADQQELGMKILSATPEERKALVEEMNEREKEREAAIATFLNNDEDTRRYKDYKERLPERQQMEGLRSVFASKDVPLDQETEPKLLEAMHRARKQSGAEDLSGAKGIEALGRGDAVASFERSWETQQTALRNEVSGILSPPQQEAFFEHQEQMKEMQLMGLKMAERMFAPKNGSN